MPKPWADDEPCCDEGRCIPDVVFKTKPEIALDQITWACEAVRLRGVVLMDAPTCIPDRNVTHRALARRLMGSPRVAVRTPASQGGACSRQRQPDRGMAVLGMSHGEPEATKYWLSTPPQDITFDQLVETAKVRRRIERKYHDLKRKVGDVDGKGRGWRGDHHHAPAASRSVDC